MLCSSDRLNHLCRTDNIHTAQVVRWRQKRCLGQQWSHVLYSARMRTPLLMLLWCAKRIMAVHRGKAHFWLRCISRASQNQCLGLVRR